MTDRELLKVTPLKPVLKVGNSEHLTLEELLELYFLNEGDNRDYLLRELHRIGEHVTGCAGCRKLWNMVRMISEIGEIYTHLLSAVKELNDPDTEQEKKQQILEYARSAVGCCNTIAFSVIPKK